MTEQIDQCVPNGDYALNTIMEQIYQDNFPYDVLNKPIDQAHLYLPREFWLAVGSSENRSLFSAALANHITFKINSLISAVITEQNCDDQHSPTTEEYSGFLTLLSTIDQLDQSSFQSLSHFRLFGFANETIENKTAFWKVLDLNPLKWFDVLDRIEKHHRLNFRSIVHVNHDIEVLDCLNRDQFTEWAQTEQKAGETVGFITDRTINEVMEFDHMVFPNRQFFRKNARDPDEFNAIIRQDLQTIWQKTREFNQKMNLILQNAIDCTHENLPSFTPVEWNLYSENQVLNDSNNFPGVVFQLANVSSKISASQQVMTNLLKMQYGSKLTI